MNVTGHTMKLHRRTSLTLVPSAVLLPPRSGMAAEVLVEAEAFADRGGWLLDPQYPKHWN